MSKDPAVSWYWNDWAGGTQGMTREEKGAYMELLQAQHSRGSVPLAWIRRLFGDDFERLWAILKEKFKRDEEGYYNVRLREEIGKRREYSESRRANRIKKKIEEEIVNASESDTVQITYDNHMNKTSKSYDKHMGIGIGNNNNSTTEYPYKGSVAITRTQGGAGGNGIAFDKLDPNDTSAIVEDVKTRMIPAYGPTGRAVKAEKIRYAVLHAIRHVCAIHKCTHTEAGDYLVFAATQAQGLDVAARNTKRPDLNTWLDDKCYEVIPKPSDVLKPPESEPERLRRLASENFNKRMEAQNGH